MRYFVELLFSIFSVIFIFKVTTLNKSLKNFYPKSKTPNLVEAQQIIQNYPTDVIGSFLIGLLLFVISLYLIYNFVSRAGNYDSVSLYVLALLSLLINIFIDIRIFQVLNNPILRIIFYILVGGISFIGYSRYKN